MKQWKRLLAGSLIVMAILAIGLIALALVLPSSAAAAPEATELTWQVIASGGQTMSSSNYTMLSTSGQPLTGTSTGANYSLMSGYWQSFQAVIRELFAPIILRP